MRLFCLVFLSALLGACSHPQVNRDYDPTRNFSSYKSWAWKNPQLIYQPDDLRLKSDLTEQRIVAAVSEQLTLLGLTKAANQSAQLLVQTALIAQQQTEFLTTTTNTWNPYWGEPTLSQTREINYWLITLQIDLYDSTDGKLIWRGNIEQPAPNAALSPAQRQSLIEQNVARVLSSYPPN